MKALLHTSSMHAFAFREFQASAPGLLHGLESRASQPEYAQLLVDCQRMYCEVRLQLMAGVTQAQITQHAQEPLPSQTRNGWAVLMQVRACNSDRVGKKT